MKLRRRFLLALVASLALHLGVLTSPSWRLPIFDDLRHREKPVTIEARLTHPPRMVVPAPARSKPDRRRPVRNAASALPVAAIPTPALPVVVPEEVAPEPASEPVAAPEPEVLPVAPPPAEIALPRRVRIRYQVSMGAGGFVIGEAIQELRRDGVSYEMRSSAATTGLAGLFKPVRVVNVSQGEVVSGGLRPREFRIERDKGSTESARFDWPGARVMLSNGRDFPLESGAQDMLSMFGQLPMMLGESNLFSLPVVTGKKVERYDFVVLGQEALMTPRGERATLHLRSSQENSKESTEIWLGLEDALLPVKIRYVDRRGDVYEQIADSLEFDSNMEGAH
jgi:hypothetical protein